MGQTLGLIKKRLRHVLEHFVRYVDEKHLAVGRGALATGKGDGQATRQKRRHPARAEHVHDALVTGADGFVPAEMIKLHGIVDIAGQTKAEVDGDDIG